MRKKRPVLFAAALAALALLPGAAPAPPAPTTTGAFAGTWYRVEPGQRQMLQLRRAATGWEVRLRWETNEKFVVDTGFRPEVEFAFRGFPGTFRLAVDPRSDDTRVIVRYQRRQAGARSSEFLEDGDAELYRVRDGQSLAWVQPVRRLVKVGEPIAPYEEDGVETRESRVWIFTKAAARLLEWDEVPW